MYSSLYETQRCIHPFIFQIFSHLHPIDLYHISITSKTLRKLLLSPDLAFAWHRSFEEHRGVVPLCPHKISGPTWVNFLFGSTVCDVGPLNFDKRPAPCADAWNIAELWVHQCILGFWPFEEAMPRLLGTSLILARYQPISITNGAILCGCRARSHCAKPRPRGGVKTILIHFSGLNSA